MSNYDGTLKFDTKVDDSGFSAGVNKLGGLAKGALGVVSKVFTAATTAVTAAGAAVLNTGGQFEAGMSKVEAISKQKLDAIGGDMEELGGWTEGLGKYAEELGVAYNDGASGVENALSLIQAKAMDAASTSVFTTAQTADALKYMGMAGWDTEQMLGGLVPIMNLATAAGEDLGTTSDIVTDAMTAFGLRAGETSDVERELLKVTEDGIEVEKRYSESLENTQRFTDVLTAAATSSNTTVSMLGESFKYVAPVAGTMGYQCEDTAFALGLMANSGIKASQAGTSLRSLLTRMAKPTKESQAAMDALGISLQDNEGNMLSMKEVLDNIRAGFGEDLQIDIGEFQTALSALDGELAAGTITQKQYDKEVEALADRTFSATGALNAEYAAMLAGKTGMAGLLAIVGASDEDYATLWNSIETSNNLTNDMTEIMKQNLPGAIDMAKSALDVLATTLYDDVGGAATDVVTQFTDMVNGMREAFLSGGWDEMATVAGEGIANIATGIMNEAPKLISMAVNLVHSFCEAIKGNSEIGTAGANLITSIITGIMSMGTDLITTGGYLVLEIAKGLVAQAPTLIESGIQMVGELFTGFTEALPEIAQVAVDLFNTLTEAIRTKLPTLIPEAMNAIVTFSGSLRENFGHIVSAGLEMIAELAHAVIMAIPTFIETVPQIITNFCGLINDNAPKIISTGLQILVDLAIGIVRAIPTLIANIPQIIQAIVSVFTAFNWASIGKNIITVIGNGIKSLSTSLPTMLKNIGTTMKNNLKNIDWGNLGMGIIKAIVTGLKAVGSLLWNGLKALGTTAVEMFKSINWLDLGMQIVLGIVSGLASAAEALWGALGDLCSGILDKFKGFFSISSPSKVMEEQGEYLTDGVLQGLEDMPSKAATIFEKVSANVKSWGSTLTSTTQNIITTLTNKFMTILNTLPGKIWTTLVNIVNKFIQWGQNVLNTCTTAITNTINKIMSLLNTLPGKIWTVLVNIVNKFIQWGQNVLQTCSTAITNTINKIMSLLNTLPGKIWTVLVDIVNRFVQWGQNVLNTCSTAISNTINKIMSLLNTLPGKIWTILVDIVNKFVSWGQNVLNTASTAISNMISKVCSLLSQLPGKVADYLNQVISKLSAWASDMASKGAQAAQGLFNAVVNGLSGLPSKMAEIGSNIVSGIWNGISGGWDWLRDKVSDLAQSLLRSAKNALGIESPSKAFRDQVGKWIPLGISEGMEKTIPDTISQMKSYASDLLAEMSGNVNFTSDMLAKKAATSAGLRLAGANGTVVYSDNSFHQENKYEVPVVTPSEVAATQREAFRKMVGGVK